MSSNKEDAVLDTPMVNRVEVAKKVADGETIYRFVDVYGNDDLGYIASSDEYFSPNRKGGNEPEFFEVRFQTAIFPTIAEALADALPSAIKEAADFSLAPAAEQVRPAIKLQPSEYEITNGYVGGFGVTYKTATEESLAEAITAAATRNNQSEIEIVQLLMDGNKVSWCNSPNHYYDHSVGYIRRKRTPASVQLVECDCGHNVPRSQVMSASLGSSCVDCYDRMSD